MMARTFAPTAGMQTAIPTLRPPPTYTMGTSINEAASTAEAMPASDASMTTAKEDSFETNNQVGLLTTDAYFFALPSSADDVFSS